MRNNIPKNHHFVPQHFLKAWEASLKKVFRYKRIQVTNKIEVKEVPIRKTASIDDLYRISLPDGSFEIESTLVTPKIDEEGHKVLKYARNSLVENWSLSRKRKLANYLTCMEARHPSILHEMDISEDLNKIREDIKSEKKYDDGIVDEYIDYLQKSNSMGVISFAAFLQNESNGLLGKPFAEGLLNAKFQECLFSDDVLISSNYPASRLGDYLQEFLFIIAISPTKSLIYSTKPNASEFKTMPIHIQYNLINLFSLAKADEAYFKNKTMLDFVDEHLGWAINLKSEIEKQEYVKNFIEMKFENA